MEFRILQTRWGWFGLVAQDDQLLATFLPRGEPQTRASIRKRFPDAVENSALLPGFSTEVQEFFEGVEVDFDVAIDLSAMTPFRKRVMSACREVPQGKTASYADLARAAGRPLAARAVGQVMARNPLPLVVPCHRIVASDRTLGGFSSPGGLGEKERLLRLEANGDQGRGSPVPIRRNAKFSKKQARAGVA